MAILTSLTNTFNIIETYRKENKQMVNEKISIFRELFRGREDVYGSGNGACIRNELTDEIILEHLQGIKRLGIYPLLQDGDVNFAVIDIDEPNLEMVQAYTDVAKDYGLPVYVEASKSKGFHLWHFFSEPVPAIKVRKVIKGIIIGAGLPENIEVFPKQDYLSGSDAVGNYINLPLYGDDIPKGRTVFLNENFQPCPDQWSILNDVEKITPEQIDEMEKDVSQPGDPQQISGLYEDMLPCVPRMMEGVSEGCRDVVAFTLAKHFRVEKGFPRDATLAILNLWNQRNDPPLDSKVIGQKVKGAYLGRNGKGYTGFGCGEELIKKFCVMNDTCPVFTKRRKELDNRKPSKANNEDNHRPYFKGKAFVPKLLADEIMMDNHFIHVGGQLYHYENGVYKQGGEKFVEVESQRRLGESTYQRRIVEVVYYIQVASYIVPEQLNMNHDIINLRNGLYNWKENKLYPHNPDYLSTIQIPVLYRPDAVCPSIDYFLVTTLPPDCMYLAEELFGYCLTADTSLNKAFMLTGSGANGKSTFLNLLEAFVGGDNVAKIPLQEISDNRFKRADIFGKLVNLFADLDAKALETSSYFKTIVSGDVIDCERKHQDPFYFRPFAKLIFSANELPRSRDNSFAYFRRWCIVQFPHQFTGDSADRNLTSKLIQLKELSGLLNRALAGLKRLNGNGRFSENSTTESALKEYEKSNDNVFAFISDCCEFSPGERLERTELYANFEEYCRSEGFNPASRQKCYKKIRSYTQIGEVMGAKGIHYFSGIRLKES
jgi:putative DNA primase/helicase